MSETFNEMALRVAQEADDVTDNDPMLAGCVTSWSEQRDIYFATRIKEELCKVQEPDELPKAADTIEALRREREELKKWNEYLTNHNKTLAQRGDDLEEQLAAVMVARNEAVSAVQRLSEGQLFNDVVHADIVRRGMEALAAMTAERDRWKAALTAERESWAQLVDHIYKSDSGTYSDAIKRLT